MRRSTVTCLPWPTMLACVGAFGGQPDVDTAYHATKFGYAKSDDNNVRALLEQVRRNTAQSGKAMALMADPGCATGANALEPTIRQLQYSPPSSLPRRLWRGLPGVAQLAQVKPKSLRAGGCRRGSRSGALGGGRGVGLAGALCQRWWLGLGRLRRQTVGLSETTGGGRIDSSYWLLVIQYS